MISKPENIPCMTTTTTDGGSICVKVMRQLRCRWWWHWWCEPEGTITSPRARWANHPPAPEITGSVALKCFALCCSMTSVWCTCCALGRCLAITESHWERVQVGGLRGSSVFLSMVLVLPSPQQHLEWILPGPEFDNQVPISAGTLLKIYRRLIGRSYIAIARQDKKYRNISNALGSTKYISQYIGCT